MLNTISGRLNEIDIKLTLILDLLNKQHNSGVGLDISPAVSMAESLIPAVNTSQNLANQLVAAVNSTSNFLNSQNSIFSDPTLASRILAACQERPDLQNAITALSNGQLPKMEVIPKLEPDTNSIPWNAMTGSTQGSPTEHSELMAAMMAAVSNQNHQNGQNLIHQTVPSPSTHQPPEDRQKVVGSADSKTFSDDVVDENEEEEEFDYEDEGDSPTATTSKQSVQGELSPAADVESSFPEGAVKRAAEKAARSFQSTQPKVFAWQILRESITDDELKNIQISLRTFHGETAAHLLSRQLPKVSDEFEK